MVIKVGEQANNAILLRDMSLLVSYDGCRELQDRYTRS
jgi:hypothetical protein